LSTNNVCVNASPITLSGGSPAGGTYSGTGVSSGQFNPSVAGVGTHTITYTYTNSNGCTGSATQTITVNACTGIIEASIANSLIIAPNPAREQLLISFNNANSNNVRVNIIAADGKLVYSENVVASSQYVKYIDVTSFAKGLYFVQILSDEGMLNNKIIVQ
ncbi:MAG: T9SS type A sorting domain-containing protein, partial [Bacteroidia bacterium]